MTHRYQSFLLLCAAVALVLTGCDQSSQKADPVDANRYIITQNNSVAGDAGTGSMVGADSVNVPDTVDYYVQGFTTNKDYTWTVNDTELSGDLIMPEVNPVPDQTFRWQNREGEFITVVYAPGDPVTTTSGTDASTNPITVDASGDEINAETIEVETVVEHTVGGQVGRFGAFSTLTGLASSAEITDELAQSGNTYTLFAPSNSVLAEGDDATGALGGTPTQATDDDEPATSSVAADLVKYHAVATDVTSDDLPVTETTLFGNTEVTIEAADVTQADIPATNGTVHKINTPLLPPTASVDFTDRALEFPFEAPDDTLNVDGIYVPEGGGFVVAHDSTDLADLGAIPSIIGTSDYLEGGVHNDVDVYLDETIDSEMTVGAMPHQDTNDNESFDFESSGGTQDGPYTLEGEAVIDYAEIAESSE